MGPVTLPANGDDRAMVGALNIFIQSAVDLRNTEPKDAHEPENELLNHMKFTRNQSALLPSNRVSLLASRTVATDAQKIRHYTCEPKYH
jgi:hypothetical protein